MSKKFIGPLLVVAFVVASTDTRAKTNRNIRGSEVAKQTSGEAALLSIRKSDEAARDKSGKPAELTPTEHMRRAAIYMANRAFEEARSHWQAVIDNYPSDIHVAEALLGIGRSYFQSKNYPLAYSTFNNLAEKFPTTKEGREGLNYSAASLLRMERFSESAARYAEYVAKFPSGERIETAHLNMIDTLREANRPREALQWVDKTRQRFAGTATETNAIFGGMRLYIAEGDWSHAIASADQLLAKTFSKAVQTSAAEVTYLKAFSFEQAGRKSEAISTYLSIPEGIDSYYGWLATQRLNKLVDKNSASVVSARDDRVRAAIAGAAESYPAPYRQTILRSAKAHNIDPRFVLALIKQESVFKPMAKSPAGARGLLQLTLDAAQKYAPGAGITLMQEGQLYLPETSIALGAEYLEELSNLFPQMLEPVAASYNGGEDNVARWLKRAGRKDPGVFTSEIGFDETKGYVQKVMANYRAYRTLYTEDLTRR